MHILEIFGQKVCLFGSKTMFLGQEMHYYMVCIVYYTELNLQVCNYAQKTAHLSRKKVNTRLTIVIMAIFALAEKLPTSATLDVTFWLVHCSSQ